MGSCDDGACSLHLAEGEAHHFMRDGIGKEDEDIGRADRTESPHSLRIDFCFTVILTAEVFIMADHTFISADDHYAHLFLFLLFCKVDEFIADGIKGIGKGVSVDRLD